MQLDISNYITMPIPPFSVASGMGRSKIYELIDAGDIESVLVGRRRLIIVSSYLAYLERQKQAQAGGIGRITSPNPRAARTRAATTQAQGKSVAQLATGPAARRPATRRAVRPRPERQSDRRSVV